MSVFCKITIGGKPVVDPPKGFGRPTNLFRMTTGAARFGRGQFLMSSYDFGYITNSTLSGVGKGGITTLVMSDGTNALELSVRIGGAIPAVTSTDKNSPDILEVIVFDLRTEQFTPVNTSFNMIAAPYTYVGGDWIYWSSTLSPVGAPWTWAGLVTKLELPSLPANPAWTPRNLPFENLGLADAMDRIAAELYLVVGFDYTVNSGVNIWNFNTPGVMNDANTKLLASLTNNSPQMGGGTFIRGVTRAPKSIKVAFPVINVNSADPYFGQYTTTVVTGGGSPAQALQVGNQPAFLLNGINQNISDLDNIADDLAHRAYTFMTVPEAAWTFSGIQPFKPDGAIREIVWHSSSAGPTTTIFQHNGRDFKQLADEFRTMELPANQLVDGMGGMQTSVSPAGTRYVFGPPSTQVMIILNDYDYTSPGPSGYGQYRASFVVGRSTASPGTQSAASAGVPAGMETGGGCLAFALEEMNYAGWRCMINSGGSPVVAGPITVLGMIVGSTPDGTAIVAFTGGIGATGNVPSTINYSISGPNPTDPPGVLPSWSIIGDSTLATVPVGSVGLSVEFSNGTESYNLIFDAKGSLQYAARLS